MTQIACFRLSDSGDKACKSWAGAGGWGGGEGRKKDIGVRAFSIQRTRLSRSLEQAMMQSAHTVLLFTGCLLNDISLYTDVVLFLFFVLFGNHYPLALAVNKSSAVYIIFYHARAYRLHTDVVLFLFFVLFGGFLVLRTPMT